MNNYRYDHVHLISADPMKAAEFYERVFGAARVSAGKSADGGTRIELRIGEMKVLIRNPRNAEQTTLDVPRKRYGLEHFGLSTNDFNAALKDFKAKGVKFLEEPAPGATFVFIQAPDNVSIEVMQAP